MAYNLRFFTEISSLPLPELGLVSERYKVFFYWNGFSGSATELPAEAGGVKLGYVDNNDEFIAIRAKQLRISMVATSSTDLGSFYTTSDRDCRVELKLWDGSAYTDTIFVGWLSAFDGREPFVCKPYPFELTAFCGLASLRDVNFKDVASGLISFNEAIRLCLLKTGLALSYIMGIQTRISGDTGDPTRLYAFYADALKEKTCYEALALILESYVADIEQEGGKWFIRGIGEQAQSAIDTYTYNSGGTQTASGTLSLTKVVGRGYNLRNEYGAITRKRPALSYLEISYDLGNVRNLLTNGDFSETGFGAFLSFPGWTAYNLSPVLFESIGPGLKIKTRIQLYLVSGYWWALGPVARANKEANFSYFQADPISIGDAESVLFSGKFQAFELDYARFEVWIVDPANPAYMLWLSESGEWQQERTMIMLDYTKNVVRVYKDAPVEYPFLPFEIKSQTIPARKLASNADRPYVNIRYSQLNVRIYRGIYDNKVVKVKNPTGPYVAFKDLYISCKARSEGDFLLKYGFRNDRYVRRNTKKVSSAFGGYSVQYNPSSARIREGYLDSYAGVIRRADGEPVTDAWTKPGTPGTYPDFVRLNGISRLRLEANSMLVWEGTIVGARFSSADLLTFSVLSGVLFKMTSFEQNLIDRTTRISARQLLNDSFSYTEALEGEEGDTTGASVPKITAGIAEPTLDIESRITAALNARFSATVVVSEAIDTTARPQFVELYNDGADSKARKSSTSIDAIIISFAAAGGVAQAFLPGMVIGNFSGLRPGVQYAYVPTTDTIVEYNVDSADQLYFGKAVSATEIIFTGSGLAPKPKADTPVPGQLFCGISNEESEDTPVDGQLFCLTPKADGPPTLGNVLTLSDIEGPNSSFSLTTSIVTTSKRRPQIAFYARLDGVILPFSSDVQYSIDGVNWYNCGKLANFKHIAEQPDSLPLRLNWATTYALRLRLSINTSIVSNVVNVTTASEPSAPEGSNARKIIWSHGDGLDRPRENGLWNLAYASGVRVMAGFNLNHWAKYERAENDYNFEELEYEFEQHAAKGYQMLIWMKPQFAYPDAPRSVTVHRKTLVGGVWTGDWNTITYSFASTSYLPPNTWERDRDGNEAAYISNNFKEDGQFSYASEYAVGRFEKLVARIAHLVKTGTTRSGKPYSEIVFGMGIIDGGFNETSFNLQYRAPGGPTDLLYSDASIAGFRTFLEEKYGNMNACNNAWDRRYVSFSEITRANIEKPTTNGGTLFEYWTNNRVKDLWEYKVSLHAAFYTRICNAIKNPSLAVSGLSSDTGILTFCYVTENFTPNEGLTYGPAAVRSMYHMFDGYLSSTTSDAPLRYFQNGTVLQEIAARAALLRATLGGPHFGQEKDGDSSEAFVGYSRIFAATRQYGGLYCCIALQMDPSFWSRPCFSIDGKQRTYAEDLKYTFDNFINNVTPPALPTLDYNVSYTERQALANVNNPNNILPAWKNAANPNGEGIVSALVGMECIDDLGTVDLLIDAGSITYVPHAGRPHGVGFRATINGNPVKSTQTYFTAIGYEFSVDGSTWFFLQATIDGDIITGPPSSGAWVSGGTYSFRIRLLGAPSKTSNIVTVTIP